MSTNENLRTDLFDVILNLKDKKQCENFFKDLCTEKEIDAMSGRLLAAKLLKNGETYEQIIAKTEISSATLSRVSRALKYGKGYKEIL